MPLWLKDGGVIRGAGGGQAGHQSRESSTHLPCALQVLGGGDPAEGQDLPADADGEGGNARQGGPAGGPRVSLLGRGHGTGRAQAQTAAGGPRGLPQCSCRRASGRGWGWGERACVRSPGSLAQPRALGRVAGHLCITDCHPGLYLQPSGGREPRSQLREP